MHCYKWHINLDIVFKVRLTFNVKLKSVREHNTVIQVVIWCCLWR